MGGKGASSSFYGIWHRVCGFCPLRFVFFLSFLFSGSHFTSLVLFKKIKIIFLSRRRPNHPYITPTTGIEAHGPTTVDLDIRNNVISLYLILYCTLVPISWGNAIFYTLTFLFTWGLHSVRCETYIAFFFLNGIYILYFSSSFYFGPAVFVLVLLTGTFRDFGRRGIHFLLSQWRDLHLILFLFLLL